MYCSGSYVLPRQCQLTFVPYLSIHSRTYLPNFTSFLLTFCCKNFFVLAPVKFMRGYLYPSHLNCKFSYGISYVPLFLLLLKYFQMTYTLYQGTRLGLALKEALEEMEVSFSASTSLKISLIFGVLVQYRTLRFQYLINR